MGFCFCFMNYSTCSRFLSSSGQNPRAGLTATYGGFLSTLPAPPGPSLHTPWPPPARAAAGASRPLLSRRRSGPAPPPARPRRLRALSPPPGRVTPGAVRAPFPPPAPRSPRHAGRRRAGRARRACHGGRLTVRLGSRA
jgi:hypothetical protein